MPGRRSHLPGIESIKIEPVRILLGPNVYAYRPVMVAIVDIGPFEELPSNKLPGFVTGLLALMPSILYHRCGIDAPGGFVERMRSGTWIGHIIEHLTLELQTLAGMDVTYGNTRSIPNRPGVYRMVIAYKDAEAARYCLDLAVRVIGAVLSGTPLELPAELATVREIAARNSPGPSTAAILRVARRRNIPRLELGEGVFQLGYGAAGQRISAAETHETSSVAVELARDKDRARRLLAAAGIPVPTGRLVHSAQEAEQAVAYLLAGGARAVVVKPARGHLGQGITLNLDKPDQAAAAYEFAKAAGGEEQALVEEQIEGNDYRLLVIGDQVVATAQRRRASIIGDGNLTVQELVAILNADPQRGTDPDLPLEAITSNPELLHTLERQGYTLDSIPPVGKEVILNAAPSLSSGGITCDVTAQLHPQNAALAIRAARLVGLPVAGVDLLAPSIDQPVEETGGVILEVNARPGLTMHLHPSEGASHDVASPIVDMLYPHSKHPKQLQDRGRIPLVAITGKYAGDTARLLASICCLHGQHTALATQAGLYLDKHLLVAGDAATPERQYAVLADSAVESAIFEVGTEGIINSGLAFDRPEVGIITTFDGELAPDQRPYARRLSDILRVVVDGIEEDGWAVLNGDEPESIELAEELEGSVIYISRHHNPDLLATHLKQNGRAVLYNSKTQTALLRQGKHTEAKISLPLPKKINLLAILSAIAGAWALGHAPERIRVAIEDCEN